MKIVLATSWPVEEVYAVKATVEKWATCADFLGEDELQRQSLPSHPCLIPGNCRVASTTSLPSGAVAGVVTAIFAVGAAAVWKRERHHLRMWKWQ
jgi:hypothetical protein